MLEPVNLNINLFDSASPTGKQPGGKKSKQAKETKRKQTRSSNSHTAKATSRTAALRKLKREGQQTVTASGGSPLRCGATPSAKQGGLSKLFHSYNRHMAI